MAARAEEAAAGLRGRAFPAAELWRMDRGRPVYEEELLDELLGDLGGGVTEGGDASAGIWARQLGLEGL